VVLQDERDLDLPAGLCLAMVQSDGARSVVIARDRNAGSSPPLALASFPGHRDPQSR
jgi:hypothetical protein